ITASVEDVLGPSGIEELVFLVDGVPTLRLNSPPFVFNLVGPPRRAGTDLVLTARVTDTGGSSVLSEALVLPVRAAAAASTGSSIFFLTSERALADQAALYAEHRKEFSPEYTPVAEGGHFIAGSVL